MKKSLAILFVFVFIVALVFFLFFFKRMLDDSKKTNSKILEIEDTYNKFEDNIDQYNKCRSNLSSLLKDSYIDYIGEKYDDIVVLLDKEQEFIKESENKVLKLKDDCRDNIYNDSSVSLICDGYLKTYEEMVNVYIKDIDNINSLIDEYSKKNPGKIERYQSDSFDEYIDYDGDGVYSGKEE